MVIVGLAIAGYRDWIIDARSLEITHEQVSEIVIFGNLIFAVIDHHASEPPALRVVMILLLGGGGHAEIDRIRHMHPSRIE